MKILLIWLASFLVAGVIISPFFWLKFLKKKSRWGYVIWSSIVTMFFLFLYIYPVSNFLNSWTAKINAAMYYFYDDFNLYPILIVIFLIVVSPFIFTKIIYNKIKLKSFLISFVLSILIFVSLFLFWVYVLLPMAFSKLHNYL